ncbi:MAG: DUF2235 domain-containing protein [Chromatiaceae bacterium]|nr:MAG: DUF2235 domain-containing protein [Chromatiaceae bacterium]
MSKQRLIVLFDGTWNDPEDRTNVYRLARHIHDRDDKIRQRFFYQPGVGTSTLSRFRGGIFGYGLSKNLRQGYQWLAKNYAENDQVWIFGFSRGAYTARSLVGLIRKCGLLHIVNPRLLARAEEIYRNKHLAPDSKICDTFRKAYSREIKIRFLGVWDTVGALGIPGTFLSEHGRYAWHDTELSGIVEHGYHAVALDECRAAYDVALWTSKDGEKKQGNQEIEQRWFIGAHANVGGGYGVDPLADISFHWMIQKAKRLGIGLADFELLPEHWKTKPTDSYNRFLGGVYAGLHNLKAGGDGRFFRQFATGFNGRPAVAVSVDESVWMRWQDPSLDYRPRTLTAARQQPPEQLTAA